MLSLDDDLPCSQIGQATSRFDFKVLNDPIHGYIQVPKALMAVVDTPQFQRLRSLKQLGGLYHVFPGACHNRFEHCIGTSHLAGRLVTQFRTKQPELELRERDCFLVQVAALTHDLGHGPFSHLFDTSVIPKLLPGTRWTHEQGSEMMLEYLIGDNGLDFSPEEVRFCKALIRGARAPNQDRAFLYQIVSNSYFNVDVDKFDYLARDCFHLGVKNSYDSSRLLNFSRVIHGDICFHAKEAYNCNELFHTRYTLHKQIYSHRVGQCVDYMIADALLAADSELRLAECIEDPERYLHLNDGVLTQIEASRSPDMRTAQGILRRLRKRDLYKFVDEVLLDDHSSHLIPYKSVTPEDVIAGYVPISQQDDLQPEDLIVQDLRISYGMRDQNPVDHIGFFRSWDDHVSFRLPSHRISLLIPDQVEERTVRLFCRTKAKLPAAQAAFRQYVAKRCLRSPGVKRKAAAMDPPRDRGIRSSPFAQPNFDDA